MSLIAKRNRIFYLCVLSSGQILAKSSYFLQAMTVPEGQSSWHNHWGFAPGAEYSEVKDDLRSLKGAVFFL